MYVVPVADYYCSLSARKAHGSRLATDRETSFILIIIIYIYILLGAFHILVGLPKNPKRTAVRTWRVVTCICVCMCVCVCVCVFGPIFICGHVFI